MKIRKTSIAFILFLFISKVYAENNEITEKDTVVIRMLANLKNANEDTLKVNILKTLGLNLLRSDPKESKKRAYQGLELSKKLNYQKGVAAAYNLLALNEEHVGNYTKSIEYYFKALKIIEKKQGKENIADLYHNIGKVYQYQQDFKLSSEYLIKGLELYREIKNHYGIANSYNTLGLLERDQNNFKKAIDYHKKALEEAKKAQDNRMIAVISLNLAGDMDYVENFELVVQSFHEALDAFVKMNDKKGEAIALNNLGSAYMENKKHEKAIGFLLKSIEKTKAINFKPLQAHNYWLINKAYSDFENYKKANEYALLLNDINDSLLNESKVQQIAELEIKYQTEKKEQELILQQKNIEVLEKDKKIKNYVLYGLLGFVFLLIISTYLWFRSYRLKKNIQETEIRYQLDLYIKEVELLKSSKEQISVHDTIKQGINSNLTNPLSERELEVFNELSKGKTNKEIADTLFVSVNTVKTHLKSIYEKLDVKNRTQAVKKVSDLEK